MPRSRPSPRAGRGVLFYLTQEGRGAGFAAKARDRMLVQASRNRLTTFEAYERLGLRPRPAALRRGRRRLPPARGQRAAARAHQQPREAGRAARRRRLRRRRTVHSPWAPRRSAATISTPSRAPAICSPPVSGDAAAAARDACTRLGRDALRGAPRFLELASYLLPLRAPGAGVVPPPPLSRRRARAASASCSRTGCRRHVPARPPLVHVQHDALLERFPLRRPRLARTWARARAAIVRHGAGMRAVPPEGETPGPTTLGAPRPPSPGPARAAGSAARSDPVVAALAQRGRRASRRPRHDGGRLARGPPQPRRNGSARCPRSSRAPRREADLPLDLGPLRVRPAGRRPGSAAPRRTPASSRTWSRSTPTAPARFLPPSALLTPGPRARRRTRWSSSRRACRRTPSSSSRMPRAGGRSVLATAVTDAGRLAPLRARGIAVVHFAGEDEYGTLVRVTGPAHRLPVRAAARARASASRVDVPRGAPRGGARGRAGGRRPASRLRCSPRRSRSSCREPTASW